MENTFEDNVGMTGTGLFLHRWMKGGHSDSKKIDKLDCFLNYYVEEDLKRRNREFDRFLTKINNIRLIKVIDNSLLSYK